MKLSEIKQSKELLLDLLNFKDSGQHLKCPFHDDTHGSFAVWESNGYWYWKCYAGCGQGTIIDAAMQIYSIISPYEALKKIQEILGVNIYRDENLQEPIIDLPRAEKIIQYAHENLLSDFEIQEKYMLKKRSISNIDVIKKYRIGFAWGLGIKGWKVWKIYGWVFPITTANGNVQAVKFHLEHRMPEQPKSLWAPYGMYPKDKPKHGISTWWPPPEEWKGCKQLIICPGELKALALISSGYHATSLTTGENRIQDHLIERIVNIQAETILLNYDNDPPKRNPKGKIFSPGNEWKEKIIKAFSEKGIAVIPFEYSSLGELQRMTIKEEVKKESIEINKMIDEEFNRAIQGSLFFEKSEIRDIDEYDEQTMKEIMRYEGIGQRLNIDGNRVIKPVFIEENNDKD